MSRFVLISTNKSAQLFQIWTGVDISQRIVPRQNIRATPALQRLINDTGVATTSKFHRCFANRYWCQAYFKVGWARVVAFAGSLLAATIVTQLTASRSMRQLDDACMVSTVTFYRDFVEIADTGRSNSESKIALASTELGASRNSPKYATV